MAKVYGYLEQKEPVTAVNTLPAALARLKKISAQEASVAAFVSTLGDYVQTKVATFKPPHTLDNYDNVTPIEFKQYRRLIGKLAELEKVASEQSIAANPAFLTALELFRTGLYERLCRDSLLVKHFKDLLPVLQAGIGAQDSWVRQPKFESMPAKRTLRSPSSRGPWLASDPTPPSANCTPSSLCMVATTTAPRPPACRQ